MFTTVKIEKKAIYRLQNFLILWQSGFGGRFFSWFVNSHKNFSNFNLIRRPDDFSLDCPMWNFETQHYHLWAEEIKPFVNNDKATKCVLDTYPHHNLAWDNYNKVELPRIIRQSQARTITLWCPDVLREEFTDRMFFHTMKYTKREQAERTMLKAIPNKIYSNVEDRFDCNIGKLLTKDEKEYKLLLEYINERPIDNWKELMDDAYSVMFKFIKDGKTKPTEYTYDKV